MTGIGVTRHFSTKAVLNSEEATMPQTGFATSTNSDSQSTVLENTVRHLSKRELLASLDGVLQRVDQVGDALPVGVAGIHERRCEADRLLDIHT